MRAFHSVEVQTHLVLVWKRDDVFLSVEVLLVLEQREQVLQLGRRDRVAAERLKKLEEFGDAALVQAVERLQRRDDLEIEAKIVRVVKYRIANNSDNFSPIRIIRPLLISLISAFRLALRFAEPY